MSRARSLARALALAVALSTSAALAQTRVVLIAHEPGDAEHSAFRQLVGELRADGYEVTVAPAADPRESVYIELESAPERLGFIIHTRAANEAEPRVDRLAASDASPAATQTLALRTVELLRGRGFGRRADDAPVPPALGGLVGAAALLHPSGFPTAIAAGLGFEYRSGAWSVEARGFLTGRTQIARAPGTATLDQTLLLGGLRYTLNPSGTWSPFAAVAAGGYAMTGRGRAIEGLEEHRRTVWSGAGGVGGGLEIVPYANERVALSLLFRADALWLAPQPTVRFLGEAVTRGGEPLVVLGSALEVSLR